MSSNVITGLFNNLKKEMSFILLSVVTLAVLASINHMAFETVAVTLFAVKIYLNMSRAIERVAVQPARIN